MLEKFYINFKPEFCQIFEADLINWKELSRPGYENSV